jgi:glutamate synthase domain-containing protein 1
MNGPFAICIASEDTLVGFTDRIKLRPLVTGEHGDRLYIASEEAAIRRIEPNIRDVHMPKAGEPVVGRVIA